MFSSIRNNFYTIMLCLIMVFLVISLVFTLYNKNVLVKNTDVKEQTEMMLSEIDKIFYRTLNRIDLGLRGYHITRDIQLFDPYNKALAEHKINIRRIDSLMQVQNNEQLTTEFTAFKEHLNGYLRHCDRMREHIYQGNDDAFLALLKEDKGYDLWLIFSPLQDRIKAYQTKLVKESKSNFKTALDRNVAFQFVFLLIGIPTLGFLMVRIKKDKKNRNQLLSNFKLNNEQYVFTNGDKTNEIDPEKIIKSSTDNIRQASGFVENITKGNYDIEWKGLTRENAHLNQENLAGHLVKMRDEMQRVKRQDQERLWETEGLAKFSDVIRNNQDTIAKLCDAAVGFLTTYIEAQQGSLFLLTEEGSDQFLSLQSCYAFDKKKYLEKRVPIGSGLVGQTFLEGEIYLLTKVPRGYVSITSGLGEATPSCVVIVPMKYNEKVECVFEIASFKVYEKYHVEFLKKAGEIVASAISNVQITESTNSMLEQTKINMEVMKEQEEEMHQNMEELQATQEEMARKDQENNKKIEEYRLREQELLKRIREMEEKTTVNN